MAKLSRPIDSDTKFYKPKEMEVGLYKFQVKGHVEWGSNKDLNIKGAFDKLSQLEQDQVNVMSIRWELECLDAPYAGWTRYFWTTYWASPEKLSEVLENKKAGFAKKNPTATDEEIEKAVEDWRPQEAIFEMLFACGLMVQDDERQEYKPSGWELTEEGFTEALISATNSVIWGKVGPIEGTKITDGIVSVSPAHEE